ncbi:MAG: Ribosomal RNA small subunit methyltransferase H [Parcubacteria group bacterium GW2011_GWF2_43_11]|nr:MAG: Ribosomal RNA small subunit methyltransferase H [Parcubacteria group bacterium GW2011_GWF2_43_11]
MHIPVLQKEVIKYLDPKPNENFIDATIGGGGHASELLQKTAPRGRVLGIDWTQEAIQGIKTYQKDMPNLILICDNFANLAEIVKQNKFNKVKGILLDLGYSSWHLEESGRGFSFQKKELLDMRYNAQNQLTAEKIVNFWSKFEIERILREYGEERFAENIAQGIIEERKSKAIQTTSQLVEIISRAVPRGYLHGRIHFATRTFQALRIAVNDELSNIEKVLPQALQVLELGGRIAVISFHSLEDRIVKNFFSAYAKGYGGQEKQIEILTKKPIVPNWQEIKINARARSAKLRVAIKI